MVDYKNSNTRQALWLVIGQSFTFLFALFTAPVLSRYLDKTEYGTYRQILYVYTVLHTLLVMGLPNVFLYYMPRLEIGQQKMLVQRITMFFIFLGIVFFVILYSTADLIADMLNNPELAVGLRLFSVFPIFTMSSTGVEAIYTSIRKTKEVAAYQVLSRSFMFLCIVLPVTIWHTGYREAIIGWGVASFLTFLVAMFMKGKPYKKVKAERIPNMFHEILNLIMPLMGASIAIFFVQAADSFYVSRYFGTQTFAELSNGYFSIPIVTILVSSLNSVLLPLLSNAEANNKMPSALQSYINAVKKTAIIVMPLLMFCLFFADDLMVALFGRQYEVSASYFRIYILRDFVKVFPVFIILTAFGFQKMYMKIFVAGAVFIWFADYMLVSISVPPVLITCISTIFWISSIVVGQMYIRRKKNISLVPKKALLSVAIILAQSFVILFLLLTVRHTIFANMNVFVSIFVFALLFYVLLLLTGKFVGIDYVVALEGVPLLGKCIRR